VYRSAPVRSRQSYRHEAFLWRDQADFTDSMVAFTREGLAAGEPVMVALVQEHTDWLRDGLGSDASYVKFVDMGELGRNPARIIPAWQEFLNAPETRGGPARGIGEPIWTGRRDVEVAECQLHEALLNVALDPRTPFWLLCPYDSTGLDAAVLDEASRSHHAILDADSYRGSTTYGGRAHVDLLFSAELPPLPEGPAEVTFAEHNVHDVFALVMREACAANLWSDKALDLASAARQLAADSLRRGADRGVVRVWNEPSALVCEVSDATAVDDVLAGRRLHGENDGLWSANHLCDLVQLRSTPVGTTIRLHSWK
jgi:DcmR-like sensory protein